MPASFDGNDGNDGNAGNGGGSAGNASSSSAGWFFPDRIDLPFAVEPSHTPTTPPGPPWLGQLPPIPIANFPNRNWSAEWTAWLAVIEFSALSFATFDPTTQAMFWPAWVPFPPPTPPLDWTTIGPPPTVPPNTEIDQLVTAATVERSDALGEIMAQSNEFASFFLNLMTARPASHPKTTAVLAIASLIGTFVAMKYKYPYARPRPSQLAPALLPPIEVPGHASFPSGHSTQAHLMALCMADVLAGTQQVPTLTTNLWTLAGVIARNREIAGLHYPSDTAAGQAFALSTHALLSGPGNTHYAATLLAAQQEWS